MLGVLRGAFPVRGTDSTRSEGDKTPCWCPRVFGEELVIVSGSHRTKYLLKKPSTELFLGPVMGPIAHSLLSPRITMLDTRQFGVLGGVGVGSKEKGNRTNTHFTATVYSSTAQERMRRQDWRWS